MVVSETDPDPCHFGIVQQVKIEGVTDTHVSFTTRSASRSGDPHECLRRTFTVPRTEVHEVPIAGAPRSVAMKSGATGPLFLSRTGWKSKTPDGFGIHGGDRAVFKWPLCAAASQQLLSKLAVVPTSITIRGHLEGETDFIDIELLGADAAPSQRIVWGGADHIDVRLTAHGARRVGRKPRATSVKLWPIWIAIKGAPAIDPSVVGEVDILNNEMADGTQELAFAKPGAPVTLSLTQDGVNAFHVTPQAIAELSTDARQAKAPCTGCAQQALEREGKRASGGARRRSHT
jgi:hypothetical protein